MRSQNVIKNVFFGFIDQLVSILCAFVLQRCFLVGFGSKYNGVMSVINQMLSFVVLFQSGIGSVTEAALYKPLAEKNMQKVTAIIKTTGAFLRKICLLFLIATLVSAIIYPFLVIDEFDWFFTFSLTLIMASSVFLQYFLSQTYVFLLFADQRHRFISIVNIIKNIIKTIVAIALIYVGFGIRTVKLGSALVFCVAPIAIMIYTKQRYKFERNAKADNKLLEQRWDNFAQQASAFVLNNSDLLVLSFFLDVYDLSVFAIYRLILNSIYMMIIPISKGFLAAIGNMNAKGEKKRLSSSVSMFETSIHVVSNVVLCAASALIVPFVLIYVKGVNDANYSRPTFALLFCLVTIIRCWRLPYQAVTVAVGHFKQMRIQNIIELVINLTVSIVLSAKFGIYGVLIGTAAAIIYRIAAYATYVSQNIINRKIISTVKRMVVSTICVTCIMIANYLIPYRTANDYIYWIFNAVIATLISALIVFLFEFIFFRKEVNMIFNTLLKLARNKMKGGNI